MPKGVIKLDVEAMKLMPQTARKLAKALGKKTHEIAVLC